MAMMRTDVSSLLHEVLEGCQDREEGFRTAAKDTLDARLDQHQSNLDAQRRWRDSRGA